MAMSSILNITEVSEVNEGIERYEHHEYEPTTHTNINTAGEIRINIEHQDLFALPYEAYLLFEGKLVKAADDGAYANSQTMD